MKIKIKRLTKDSVLPSYSKSGDAGMDLTATTKWYDEFGNVCYGTGLAFEIPDTYVGLIFPRSSISKTELSLANSVPVIDSGYRGEVVLKFKPTLLYYDDAEEASISETFDFIGYTYDSAQHSENSEYKVGDRIGQIMIMPVPKIEFVEVTELSESDRGEGGFGSTGA